MPLQSKQLAVYIVTEVEDHIVWTKVGSAFRNHDGSINLQLEALPLTGKLHIRDAGADFVVPARKWAQLVKLAKASMEK